MSDTASHDVSDLRSAATSVRAVAVEAQVASISTTINMIMLKCWGADKVGQAFAGVYLPPATEVMDHILDTGPQLGQIADTLAGSAGGYAETEQTNQGQATTMVDPGAPPAPPIEV